MDTSNVSCYQLVSERVPFHRRPLLRSANVFQGKPHRIRQIEDRIKILKLVCDFVQQTGRFEDAKSNVFKMKRRDNYYKLHNSYHKASLMVLDQFSNNNNINGELVHKDDMDFDELIDEDNGQDDLDDDDDEWYQDRDECFAELEMNQEYNYESFVFDRG